LRVTLDQMSAFRDFNGRSSEERYRRKNLLVKIGGFTASFPTGSGSLGEPFGCELHGVLALAH
jgi:hypothetical protein